MHFVHCLVFKSKEDNDDPPIRELFIDIQMIPRIGELIIFTTDDEEKKDVFTEVFQILHYASSSETKILLWVNRDIDNIHRMFMGELHMAKHKEKPDNNSK